MSELNEWIKALLSQHRPDRYEPGVAEEWMDPVVELVATKIDPVKAVRQYADSITKNLEGQQTQSTNRLLRHMYQGRTLPLDWSDSYHTPLAVGKERVALRACTPEDLEAFANIERRHAARDFAKRNETCEAAEWLWEVMIASGRNFGHELTPEDL